MKRILFFLSAICIKLLPCFYLLLILFSATIYSQKKATIGCSINIKLAPEGFYDASSNRLNMKDTVKAYLINVYEPYFRDSAKAVIDSITFEGNFIFSNVRSGKYYLVVNHRNSIESWSKEGGEIVIAGASSSYNFTDDHLKTYGENMKKKGNIWCLYSGDVNQDGLVDSGDLGIVDNDNALYVSGYVSTDVNGDGIVDSGDLGIVDNNNATYAGETKPTLPEGTCPDIQFVDYGGKRYHTVKIGSQCWLKENLNIGNPIFIKNVDSPHDNGIIEKYCFNDSINNCETYGGLYNWKEAIGWPCSRGDGREVEGAKGICPGGWHIPKWDEFQALKLTVGNDSYSIESLNQQGTNTTGFSAMLGGYLYLDLFSGVNDFGLFWTSQGLRANYPADSVDICSAWNAHYITLSHTPFLIDDNWFNSNDGMSVRCIKNLDTVPQSPILVLPINGDSIITKSPVLSWNPSYEATNYRLQLSTDNQFNNITHDQNILTATSCQVFGLIYSTTYYWRISASNNIGTSNWSMTRNFVTTSSGIPCPGIPSVDYGGITYNTVKIGDQCWLGENLKIGIKISSETSSSNNGVIEKHCYNDDSIYCQYYGGNYNWDEAMGYTTIENAQGICPTGWHIPSYAEFQTLKTNVNNDGKALKAIDETGTNTSGFWAVLAGIFNPPYFIHQGWETYFWGSTEYDTNSASQMRIDNGSGIQIGYSGKNWGFSVRCIKN